MVIKSTKIILALSAMLLFSACETIYVTEENYFVPPPKVIVIEQPSHPHKGHYQQPSPPPHKGHHYQHPSQPPSLAKPSEPSHGHHKHKDKNPAPGRISPAPPSALPVANPPEASKPEPDNKKHHRSRDSYDGKKPKKDTVDQRDAI